MSWRTVIVARRAKLELKLSYLVIRSDEEIKIHLSEVSTLIVESTATSLTAALLCELTKRRIKVIFCDEKRNPSSELIPCYGSHDTSSKIRSQIAWQPNMKSLVWTEIVIDKIRKQKEFLERLNKSESGLLDVYLSQVSNGDESNREGHAAKVYFNALFGLKFTRSAESPINAALNYGYGILLSAFNREIVANGYITQLGLFHDNIFNPFNLASDFMEPFRILIDIQVYGMDFLEFDKQQKYQIVDVLNQRVSIDGKSQYVNNAIKIYCRSIFDALNEEDISLIRFYKNEL